MGRAERRVLHANTPLSCEQTSPEIVESLLEGLLADNVVSLGLVLVAGYADQWPSGDVLQGLVGDGESLRQVGPFAIGK